MSKGDERIDSIVNTGGKLTPDQRWMYEQRHKTEGDHPEVAKDRIAKEQSLGWRWPWVVIVMLTATTFCVCWVKVSSIMANKDIQIEQIRTNGTKQ